MLRKPLRKIPGIGPVNEYYLKGLKIETVQENQDDEETDSGDEG